MKELDLTVELLKSIFEDDITFQQALKKKFKNNVSLKDLRPTVAALLGCVLRHNILFDEITKQLGEITNTEKYVIYVALANEYYVRRIKTEDVHQFIKDNVRQEYIEQVEKLLVKKDDLDSYIPDSIPKNSPKYLSVRFNTPEWVLKVWKHFGTSITFKMLRKNLRPASNFVRIRDSLVSLSDVLADSSFIPTSVPNILEYKGKDSLRKNGFFIRGELFNEKPAMKSVLDKFSITSDNAEVMIFNGNTSDSASLEVLEFYGERIGINIGVYSIANHPAIAKVLSRTGQKNVNYFEADPTSMMANISTEQDLVIVYPESTNFDMIRENPDYLLHFKKETMDKILEQQKELLDGCSKYVADKGYLLYMVPTVSIKECRARVNEFLKSNTDFRIIEEKQMFPFDEGQSCLYYAYLQKGLDVAKLGVPPTATILPNSSNEIVSQAAKSEN